MDRKKVTRATSHAMVCKTIDCDSPHHHKDRHTKCLVCLSPKHCDKSHRYNTCNICKNMAGFSYRDRKLLMERLLKSPRRQSVDQSLVSIVTWGTEPTVTEESGQGSVLWDSGSSSSEESISGSPGNPSTHFREGAGEEAVKEFIPPSLPRSGWIHSHTLSTGEVCGGSKEGTSG